MSDLLGDSNAPAQPGALESQVSKAAKAVDGRTAEAHGRALLAHLADAPESAVELEALLVLGLSYFVRTYYQHEVKDYHPFDSERELQLQQTKPEKR